MRLFPKYRKYFFSVWIVLFCNSAFSVEYKWNGLADLRLHLTDTNSNHDISSFLDGDYGKFQYQDASGLALSQLAVKFVVDWDNNFSLHLISNSYLDGVKDSLGVTESFIKYNGLPTSNGYKTQLRAGIFYPRVSMENFAIAWNSPYSLSYSAINSWIAEEVRHIGLEASITRLGKFHQSDNDFTATLALLNNNDTSGALLAWHGWNISSRQTLWQEKIPLPNASIRAPGAALDEQAEQSDPFVELDDRIGAHASLEWRWKRKLKLLIGRYDNRAHPFIRINGQYGWHTRFSHFGLRWQLDNDVTLISQFLQGDTLMQSIQRQDVVNNDFDSIFLCIRKNGTITA